MIEFLIVIVDNVLIAKIMLVCRRKLLRRYLQMDQFQHGLYAYFSQEVELRRSSAYATFKCQSDLS